jgi:pimeloyl-ACP methyl ester carboxylesterase
MKNIVFFVCAVEALFTQAGCLSQSTVESSPEHVIRTEDLRYPHYGDNIEPVDYGNPGNWLAAGADGGCDADVFFLYPTSWRAAYGEYPIAGINNTDMRHWANYYLKTRASAFETAGNIYAPFYRQLDASFVIAQQSADGIGYFGGVPLTDVAAAFDYYLEHYNKGKPFILVGHSQGSFVMAALIALHLRDRPDVYERMIAAYLIGMPIPRMVYERFTHMKPAQNADDLGVIISYNTNTPVVDGKDPFSYPSNVLINPISWVTDESYAPKDASKGGIIVNEDGSFVRAPNLADAQIDLSTGTLVANVDREKFSSGAASRGYFPLGVLHENDIPLYYYDLRANAEKRVKNWFAANGKRPD